MSAEASGPSPACGRGRAAGAGEGFRVRRFAPIPHPALRATFSRREKESHALVGTRGDFTEHLAQTRAPIGQF